MAPDAAQQIHGLAAQFASATAAGTGDGWLQPVSDFLRQIRSVFGMDVAFVSEFVDERRLFHVVSADVDRPELQAGMADPLIDTYCRMIVEGSLPRVIGDARAHPVAAGMPITERLGIGAYLSAVVTLRAGGVFGTVCCISHSARADLQERDALALQAVADAIALSIDTHGRLQSPIWNRGWTGR